MHRTTLFYILQIVLAVSFVLGSTAETSLDSWGGWLLGPDLAWGGIGKYSCQRIWAQIEQYRRSKSKSWGIALFRSLMLWGMWQVSGRVGWDWLQMLPWVIWLLPEGSLQGWLWQIQRLVILGYAALALVGILQGRTVIWGSVLGMSCVVCGREEAWVEISQMEDGGYQADLCGHFSLQVAGDHPIRLRLLLIFVGLLQSDNDQRQSRRTRDGRTPFVRQEQMASWTNRNTSVCGSSTG